MTKEEAIARLNSVREQIKCRVSCTSFLKKAPKGGYICPVCGSGSGSHGTGACKYYPETNTWACHICEDPKTGKHLGGDVIKLYEVVHGVSHMEALKALGDMACVDVESARRDYAQAMGELRNEEREKKAPPTPASQPPAAHTKPNFEDYFAECRERLPMAERYLSFRGISMETAAAYGLGFDPASDPAQSKHPCPRLIIPAGSSYYVARRTDGGSEYAKMNPKGVSAEIFNAEAIKGESKKIFIVEGAMDALSIIEAGEPALALNSAANAGKLVKMLEDEPTKSTFILCLDNDDGGRKATETLKSGLLRLNVPFIVADICGDSKDPNDALRRDKPSFLSAIAKAKKLATAKPDNTSLYVEVLMGTEIEKFRRDIPTGYTELDGIIGGLYPGLYAVAAVSSLGKTTFCLQMAEQIAAGGTDVIFFSLEQSRLELVSKGIARRTAQEDIQKAVSSLSIRKGYMPDIVMRAAKRYTEELGDRFSIVEGNFNCDIPFIGEYLRNYIGVNGVRPVVFLDYLQILSPEKERQSTKETVDSAVVELKRLSRELNIPIVAISSVNRANYLTPVDFESLKESGNIEYTCDCVWGLQFQCLNDSSIFCKEGKVVEKRKKIKSARNANPRKIELVSLKNRYGMATFSAYFDYFPTCDLFDTCTEYDFIKYDSPQGGRTL